MHWSTTSSHIQVEVEVENVDKGGNFIGWLYIEGKNLSITLVEVCTVESFCVFASFPGHRRMAWELPQV